MIGGKVMDRKIDSLATRQLCNAILQLKTEEECLAFFKDLCTVTEILSLSQRLEVAKLLRKDMTYLKIAEETGASTATISRVNRVLNYGNGMYDVVLDRKMDSDDK